MDSPELWFIGFFVLILGAAVGSFLNVVIYRIPEGLSLVKPPSRCPQCKTQLKFYDNVPILGWLWLKGRCRYCSCSIPARYPLIEAATAFLFVLTYVAFGPTLQTVGYCLFLSWLLALTMIDFDLMILPNALTQSGVIAGWVFQGVIAFNQTPTWMGAVKGISGAFIASILGLWLFDSIRILGAWAFGQDAMGGGAQTEAGRRDGAVRNLRAREPTREIGTDVQDLGRPLLERKQRVERRDAVRLRGRDVEAAGRVAERARRHPADAPLCRAQRRKKELPPVAVAARDAVSLVRLDADDGVDRGALSVGGRRLDELEVRQPVPV